MESPDIQITKVDIIVNTDIERQEVAFSKRMNSKTDDCVPESAAAQHIQASIRANNTYPSNQSRFCFQYLFFTSGVQFQASLSPPPADFARGWIFLKAGSNRIVSIDYVTCPPMADRFHGLNVLTHLHCAALGKAWGP
jgi:hypothetical protein